MKVSLIAVCHHSSAVVPRCLASFRSQAGAAGFATEVILVEQSENDGEAAAVAASGPDRLLRRANRGYAAGLNAGIAEASGDVLLLANPDIEFLDGSVGALVDAVGSRADVAGPQLLWDSAGEVLLPIPDDPRPMAELARTVNRRWPSARAIEHRIAAAWRIWTAERPCAVPSLRGPLLVATGDTVRRLGPLDEGYFLYYEETEWLVRARRRGARLVVVPGSRVVHRWGHSTGRRPDLAEIEGRSRVRFFRRNYPAAVRAILGRLSKPPSRPDAGFERVDGPWGVPEVDADVWLLSIGSGMEPSVGCLRVSSLPSAARELTERGRWYAVAGRLEEHRWRLRGGWWWERA